MKMHLKTVLQVGVNNMKRYIKSSHSADLSEQDIIDIFGKSIWDMTMQEIRDNHLEDVWAELVDKNAKD